MRSTNLFKIDMNFWAEVKFKLLMWSCLFLCKKCERLLLYLYCHELSIEFQEPVPASVSLLKKNLWCIFGMDISRSLKLSLGRNWLCLLEACALGQSKSSGCHPVFCGSERARSWVCSFSVRRLRSHLKPRQLQILPPGSCWVGGECLGIPMKFKMVLGRSFKWKEERNCCDSSVF